MSAMTTFFISRFDLILDIYLLRSLSHFVFFLGAGYLESLLSLDVYVLQMKILEPNRSGLYIQPRKAHSKTSLFPFLLVVINTICSPPICVEILLNLETVYICQTRWRIIMSQT